MKLIVCLDEYNGMSFNGRRQSRDRVVTEWICKIVADGVLWTGASSVQLFQAYGLKVKTAEDYLAEAGWNEFCFAENSDVSVFLPTAEKVYVFRWNREYPADLYFPIDLLRDEFSCVDKIEFEGYSHPSVTLEVYSR